MKNVRIIQPLLTNGNILLRPYKKKDAISLFEAVKESQNELWPWLPFAHQDYAIVESRKWLQSHAEEVKRGVAYNFGIFDAADGSFIGGCGINDVDRVNRRGNLGYWVRTSRTGNGIAVAATGLLAAWGFRELGLHRIEILVAADNQKSLRTAEKTGAVREGLLYNRLLLEGISHDAVIFSLTPENI